MHIGAPDGDPGALDQLIGEENFLQLHVAQAIGTADEMADFYENETNLKLTTAVETIKK